MSATAKRIGEVVDGPTHPHFPDLFDVDLEQALLGSVLINNAHFWRADALMTSGDFYDPMHKRLWEAIGRKVVRGEIASPLTLKGFADTDSGVTEIGGMAYLKSIALSAPALANVADYARSISDLGGRRALVRAAEDAIDAAYYNRDRSAAEIADSANEALYDAAHRDEAGGEPEDIGALMTKAAQAAEDARNNPDQTHISTGLPSLDRALGGLFPRDLTVLGAAPNMGKTGLTQQITLSAARAGKRTLFFSLEMASLEISTRYAAAEANVSSDRIEQGRTSDADMDRLAAVPSRYSELPLWVDGTGALSVAQIRARAHGLRRRRGGIDLIAIDHLRFILPADRRSEERDQIQQITKDLKTLAKELNVAVLLVAHLNREFWKRQSRRPIVSDLYGSSAIEQNADHIWFLHREEFYLEREQPDMKDAKAFDAWAANMERHQGLAEIFSAKRRRGPLGSAKLRFDQPFVRFREIEELAPKLRG